MYSKKINLDNRTYEVDIYSNDHETSNENTINFVIPIYSSNEVQAKISELCIKSIIKFTKQNYKFWLVDNGSPNELWKWALKYEKTTLIRNNTKIKPRFINRKKARGTYFRRAKNGFSYENAIALELGVALIDNNSKYLMTLQNDTCATSQDWLDESLLKISQGFSIAAFRKENSKTKELVAHSLGSLINFDHFKKIKPSFFPNLPHYDCGDEVTLKMYSNNKKVHFVRNTYNDSSLIEKVPKKYRFLNVDRAVNKNNDVIFMHLGRGSLREDLHYVGWNNWTSAEDWINFIESEIL